MRGRRREQPHIMVALSQATPTKVFLQPGTRQVSTSLGLKARAAMEPCTDQYSPRGGRCYSDANRASFNSDHQHRASYRREPSGAMHVKVHRTPKRYRVLCADIARRWGVTLHGTIGLHGNVWLQEGDSAIDHAGCPDLAPNGWPATAQQILDKQRIT